MKKLLFFLSILCSFQLMTAQTSKSSDKPVSKTTNTQNTTENTKAEKVNWLTWKELETAYNKEPKLVFIDIYTSWCGWCKKLDKNTFTDPAAVKYINENYYAVKFDAEKPEDITFNGEKYKFKKGVGRNGFSELAYNFLQGRMSFPSLVVLDKDLGILTVVQSYIDADTWDAVLRYFGDDIHTSGLHWEKHLQQHIEKRKNEASEVRSEK